MTEPQFHLRWEFGLPAAGPLKAFAASPGGRILLGSFEGLQRNRFIMLDQGKSQLMRNDIDTGNHVITCITWGPDFQFFLGNNHGDVYCGSIQNNDNLRLEEILVGLGNGASILAVSFSYQQNVLAIAIGSRIHTYKFSGGALHDGRNWTYLKSLEPFGDSTVITTMKFIGRDLNQLLIGSSEGMSVWLTEDFTIRPLIADYAFAVVHCATTSSADYIAVTTQAHTLIVWPLFDSGLATYERRVIGIAGRQSSVEEVSPLALTDSGLIVTRSLSGYVYFKKLTKPTQTGQQEYGTHCKITALEAQGNYLFTGGNSPTGLLTIAAWSSHPPDFDQDPQRPIPITHLSSVLRTLERSVANSMDEPKSLTVEKGHVICHGIRLLSVGMIGLVIGGFMLGAALYAVVFFNHMLHKFMGPKGAQLPTANILVVSEVAYGIMHPSIIILQYATFVLEQLITFLGSVYTEFGVIVTEHVDWTASSTLVSFAVYVFLA
ncbi:hypothetical protein FRC11_011130 [Ceratobasidium sp. 423]|nr:hypothetical protein FRC11_011130 [Ceratobasidium sp. 423]